jgi:eukaryotic-like serine/threonine-protein kinase
VASQGATDRTGQGQFPRRFSDRYVLLKELGRGGMGQVYMGVTGEAGAQRVCALKIIRGFSTDRDPAELAARFLDEAKVVTRLSHENLVFVFDYGVVKNQGYLAMEFVEGKTLTELWNRCALRGVGFPVGISLHIVGELCAGLGYAHRTGDLSLVHRDVSPSNVMLAYTGGVKLIDFGLAKWKSKLSETASGINWGKVSYMSPEQHLGRTVDHRSDLFSAGLILWELLTGRQLYPNAESRGAELDIAPPSRLNPHIPPELDATVMRALAEDPSERFQTGEEMSVALAAHTPRETGKLALGEFVRSLFEIDLQAESDERELLVAGAGAALTAAGSSARRGTPTGSSSDERDPLLGTVLADRYFVRRLVGEGAMGRVYEGHHTGIGKRVAIKIPRHGERRKSELLQRFRLEAQAASQIRHPNIADVTDCGSTPDGRFFFVMEFVDGIDLSALVRRQGALPIERALLIAVQVCRAIEAAHKAGIIHRDLKPSNVMLLRRGEHEESDHGDFIKVLDFGVAKFLRADVASLGTDLTRAEAAVGTPKYMAPEQIERGNDIDFRVDIYALGGLVYFMLSGGHAPIEGDSVENVWRKKITEEATPLARWRSDLPPAVERLVMDCVAREPARRPASMESLRKELLGAIEKLRLVGSNVLGRAPSSTSVVEERVRPAAARRSGRGAWLLLGIGGAVVGAVALLVDRVAAPGAGGFPPPAPVTAERAPTSVPRPSPLPSLTTATVRRELPAPAPASPTAAPPPARAPAPAPTAVAVAARRAPAAPETRPAAPVEPPEAADKRPPARPVTAPPAAKPRPSRDSVVARLLADAELGFQEAHFNDAERAALRGLEAGGGPEFLVMLGKIYRTTGEYERALAVYERALKLEAGNERAREGRRKVLQALGRE